MRWNLMAAVTVVNRADDARRQARRSGYRFDQITAGRFPVGPGNANEL
jgi:hypothetical protein